jgi:hypothetical protein
MASLAQIGTVVASFIPSFGSDSVAIFDQDYQQLFQDARALKATVKEEAKLMEHPVESGATIVDHRIILPVEIELALILTSGAYQNTYNQIRDYYYNGTLLTIQTKSGIYQNQLIQSMPHEEDPSQYDVLTLILSTKQVIFVTAQYGTTPKNAANTNTVDRGTQQGATANAVQTGSIGGTVITNKGEVVNPKNLPK